MNFRSSYLLPLWYWFCIFWESHICYIRILNLFFTEYLELRPERSDFGRWEKIIMEHLWVKSHSRILCLRRLEDHDHMTHLHVWCSFHLKAEIMERPILIIRFCKLLFILSFRKTQMSVEILDFNIWRKEISFCKFFFGLSIMAKDSF